MPAKSTFTSDDLKPFLDSRRAWIVCAGAFFASFISFGFTYCFGVFVKPIAAEFHAPHVYVTSLFSALAVIACVLSPFTGKLADRYGPRPLIAIGAISMGVGLLLTARVHSFWLLFFTFSFGLGAPIALAYIPALAAVGKWFKKYRTLAIGITITGIGVGTMIAAPVSALLLKRYGWRGSFEIIAYAGTGLLLLCMLFIEHPPHKTSAKRVPIMDAVRTRAFFFLYVSLLFARIAVYVSMVYLPAYSEDIGIGAVAGAALVGYIGAASIFGRLGLDALTERYGLVRIYQMSYVIMTVGFIVWLAAHTYFTLVIFALVMGIGYGGLAAMYSAVAAALFGTEELGELVGLLFTSFGVSCVIGPPLAALLVDYTHDYKYPVFVSVAAAVMSLALVVPLKKHAAARQAQQAAAAAD